MTDAKPTSTCPSLLHKNPLFHRLLNIRPVFNTALLVSKSLQSGCPKYLEPFVEPGHSVYNTRRSQSDGVVFVTV